MKKILPWLIPLLTNIIVITITQWLNHYAIIFGIHANISAILGIFSSLYLRFYYQGLLVSVFTFSIYYAHYEVDTMNLMMLYSVTQHSFLYYYRKKVSLGNRTQWIILGLSTTLLVNLLLSAIYIEPTNARHYLIVIVNLSVNIMFVVGLIPWFFQLQKRAYAFFELLSFKTALVTADEST